MKLHMVRDPKTGRFTKRSHVEPKRRSKMEQRYLLAEGYRIFWKYAFIVTWSGLILFITIKSML